MAQHSNFIKYFGAIFMEYGKGGWRVSIGRVGWWIVLSPAMYVWAVGMGKDDIASGHLTTLMALTAYNLGKKLSAIADKKFNGVDNNGPE